MAFSVMAMLLEITLFALLLQGKGLAKTYWLVGKEGFTKPIPEPPAQG